MVVAFYVKFLDNLVYGSFDLINIIIDTITNRSYTIDRKKMNCWLIDAAYVIYIYKYLSLKAEAHINYY